LTTLSSVDRGNPATNRISRGTLNEASVARQAVSMRSRKASLEMVFKSLAVQLDDDLIRYLPE